MRGATASDRAGESSLFWQKASTDSPNFPDSIEQPSAPRNPKFMLLLLLVASTRFLYSQFRSRKSK